MNVSLLALTETKMKDNWEILWCRVSGICAEGQENKIAVESEVISYIELEASPPSTFTKTSTLSEAPVTLMTNSHWFNV